MMRVERNEYNRKNKPKYGILDIALDNNGNISYDYNFHEFKSAADSSSVFDYSQAAKEKAKSITLETFKQNLELGIASISNASGVESILNALPDDEVKKGSLKLYSDALQNMPDTYDVKQGYQQNTNTKYISKVMIKNFQSHTDTTVEFSNGLNVILGESNNGKTVILRAITWVLDNYPLGTDFITAGKNDCSVTVQYSDGSSITRERSRKGDSGSYLVHMFDPMTNKWIDNSYKGFTNAVPVEVDNIHQMPKVSITKNLETHLNMMSQLDEPFLITASPQDKSAAIGRITGVHIADAAISEANKVIRNDKQAIQTNNTNIQNMKDAISKLPDLNKLKAIEVLSDKVTKYAKGLNDMICTVNGLITSIVSINHEIAAKKAELSNARKKAMLSTVVNKTVDKARTLKELSTAYDQVGECTVKVKQYSDTLEKYKVVRNMSSIVTKAWENVKTISDIRTYIDTIDKTGIQHLNITAKRDLLNEWAQRSKVAVTNAIGLCEYISQVNTMLESCANISNSIDITSASLGNSEAEKGKRIAEFTAMKKKINAEIVKKGICPCCGQIVKEEHANKILEFIGGD
jgi:hypothetical protein